MKLHIFINEILDIAKTQNTTTEIARRMFLANVENVKEPFLPHYKGAKTDYNKLHTHHAEFLASEADFDEKYQKNKKTILDLYKEGERKEIYKIMND